MFELKTNRRLPLADPFAQKLILYFAPAITGKTPEEITADMDLTKPVLVLDHEPKELQELADAGVDVDLGGHTHDGQMFPGNIVMKFLWENPCGYLKKDQMHSIVTSGAGLFGPNMRVGTKAEICVVDIRFEGE